MSVDSGTGLSTPQTECSEKSMAAQAAQLQNLGCFSHSSTPSLHSALTRCTPLNPSHIPALGP